MGYVSLNISDKNFVDLLEESIKNKTPLSMSRFGDGEIMFLNKNLPPKIKQKFKKNWLNNNISVVEGEKMVVEILKNSLKNTDILGFMNLNNNICKKMGCGKKQWSIDEKTIKATGREKKINICDHQIARSNLLGDPKNIKKILNGEDISVVSPRVKLLKNKKLDKLLGCKINYVEIPINYKISDRDKIFESINNINENIVLFSIGVIGKDMPSYLSNHKNKIALDFGATIDGWAGIKARGWFSNLQNHCLIK